jgi:hypothetical protein
VSNNLDKASLIALLALVNETGTLPATAQLDSLGRLTDGVTATASLQQLDGSRMIEEYVDGSGTAENPFAVLLRIKPADSNDRADAAGALMALGDALELTWHSGTLPPGWTRLEGISTATLIERDDDGSEIWRASFVLESERGAPALA